MPRETKRRISFADTTPAQIDKARITVMPGPAPTIRAPELDSPLRAVAGALGILAEGEYATQKRKQEELDAKGRAEAAVLEGRRLEEFPDEHDRFAFYFSAADAAMKSQSLVDNISAEIVKRADDDTFDADAYTNEQLGAFLSTMDNHQRNNALPALRKLPGILQAEKERRSDAAIAEVYAAGLEAAHIRAEKAMDAGDWSQAAAEIDANFEDAKALGGPFDPQAQSQAEVNLILARLEEKGYSPELEEFAKRTRQNGSSLWHNPKFSKGLRAAFDRAKATGTTGKSLETYLRLDALSRAAEDEETTGLAVAEVTQMLEQGLIKNSDAAKILIKAQDTERRAAELQGITDAIIADDFEALAKAKADEDTVNDVANRMVKQYMASNKNISQEQAWMDVTRLMVERGFKVPTDLKRQVIGMVRGGKYGPAAELYQWAQKVSPWVAQDFVKPEMAAVLEYYTQYGQYLPAEELNKVMDGAVDKMQAARQMMADGDFKRNHLNARINRLNIQTADGRDRFRQYATMALALGNKPNEAMDLAEDLYKKTTITDYADGTELVPANIPNGYEREDVQRVVRDVPLRAWLKRMGISDKNWMGLNDVTNDLRITPIGDGDAILGTEEGTIIAVIPLAEWTETAISEIDARKRRTQDRADKARAEQLNKGAPEFPEALF